MFMRSELALRGDVEGLFGGDVELKSVEQDELLRAQFGQAAGCALADDAILMKLDVACDFQGTRVRHQPRQPLVFVDGG
jgi:hypothetical protein